jgi:hypothetical protein
MRSLTSRGHAPSDVDFDDEEAVAMQPRDAEVARHGHLDEAKIQTVQFQGKPPAAPHPQDQSSISKVGETAAQSTQLIEAEASAASVPQDHRVPLDSVRSSTKLQSDGKKALQPHQANQTKLEDNVILLNHTDVNNHGAGPTSEQLSSGGARHLSAELALNSTPISNSSGKHDLSAASQHGNVFSILLIQQLSNYSRTAMLHVAKGSQSLSHALLLAVREPPKAPTIFLAFGAFTLLGLGSLFLCFVAVGGEQREEPRKTHEPGIKTPVMPQMPASYLTMQRQDEIRSMPTTTNADGQFCPELVVPPGRECVLLVPMKTMAFSISTENEDYQVVDLRGNAVLRVRLSPGTRRSMNMLAPEPVGSAGGYSVGKITLMAEGTEEILAYCIPCAGLDAIVGPGSKKRGGEFTIHHSSGELFGNIQGVSLPDWESPEERYVLSSASGRLHFWGSLEDFALNVTDDQGVLLATTERCSVDFTTRNEYFRLRVAPLADVGLILCGLLSLSKLEVYRSTQPALE